MDTLTINQREGTAWGRWLEPAGAEQGQEYAATYVHMFSGYTGFSTRQVK